MQNLKNVSEYLEGEKEVPGKKENVNTVKFQQRFKVKF